MLRHAAIFASLLLAAACGGSTSDTDAGHTDAAAMDGARLDAPGSDGSCTVDVDGDGHRAISCGGDDCDDGDPNAYPGNPEVCDAAGHDEDCNPATLGPDRDGDGFVAPTCCDRQASGTLLCGDDCDDTRATVNPSAVEVCNGIDDNCDGTIDEGLPMATFHPDCDADGYGDPHGMAVTTCATVPAMLADCGGGMGGGWSTRSTDCDDTRDFIHPGAIERCDGFDDDCDGTGETDADGDGHFAPAMCATGTGTLPADDCRDDIAAVNPGDTAYFPLPACPPGATPCERSNDVLGMGGMIVGTSYDWHCVPGASCPSPYHCGAFTPCDSAPLATWDYDCSGTDDPEPAGVGGATCFRALSMCYPSHLTYTGTPPACGDATGVQFCTCSGVGMMGSCPSSCVAAPLPCR